MREIRKAAAAATIVLAIIPGGAQAETHNKRQPQLVASFYASGARTASGERFDPHGLTAAHRSLPFGTLLTVRHGRKAVTVRINDRGPFVHRRSLDLSLGAARALGAHRRGVFRVRAESPMPRPRPADPR